MAGWRIGVLQGIARQQASLVRIADCPGLFGHVIADERVDAVLPEAQ